MLLETHIMNDGKPDEYYITDYIGCINPLDFKANTSMDNLSSDEAELMKIDDDDQARQSKLISLSLQLIN